VQLVAQMLGQRRGGILHALEVEALVAQRRADYVGKAVGLERFGGWVEVERPIVVGLGQDQIVGAGLLCRLVAVELLIVVSGGRLLGIAIADRGFEQRVLRHLLG
jgi:hypothetical protein